MRPSSRRPVFIPDDFNVSSVKTANGVRGEGMLNPRHGHHTESVRKG